MKAKIERPQSLNPLILQSFNQESWNQRITQSANQPIKKASAENSEKNSGKSFSGFACCRASGRATQKLKPQGAGVWTPPPQASTGFRSCARQRTRKALAAQGNLGCEGTKAAIR